MAVLSATADVVAAEGLAVTPTSLFAAAMSALERPETQATHQASVRGREGARVRGAARGRAVLLLLRRRQRRRRHEHARQSHGTCMRCAGGAFRCGGQLRGDGRGEEDGLASATVPFEPVSSRLSRGPGAGKSNVLGMAWHRLGGRRLR
eukprot:365427-Chlamydomonas_euryale.AAC.7